MKIRARAHANIALVKYWGKAQRELNLPAKGSLSLTLDALHTTTALSFSQADDFQIEGSGQDSKTNTKISAFLDLAWSLKHRSESDKRRPSVAMVSKNNFPTASGLASSASAFAALALAANRLFELGLTKRQLSILARQGSGSAARSIFGGLVRMHAGSSSDDCYAEGIHCDLERDLPLAMVVAVVGKGVKKEYSSTEAMTHCAQSSPLYDAWLNCVDGDLDSAEAAINACDLSALGTIVEGSAMAMHAAAIASRPSILYWQDTSVRLLHALRTLKNRRPSVHAYGTMDAGPHLKVLCAAKDVTAVKDELEAIEGVGSIIVSGPGQAASLVEEADG